MTTPDSPTPKSPASASPTPDSPTPPTRDSAVLLARIRRPQGRKGEVLAEILTDFPEKFAERRSLWLLPSDAASTNPPRPITLIHHWLHKGAIVLHFEGISSITAAESLTGLLVAIPRAQRTPLADDEFYIADLAGCTLLDVAPPQPVIVGVIEDIDRTAGPIPLLVVNGPTGEVLVPFAKTFLRRVDLEAKRVEMALPAGLTTLNTPDAPKP
jgi:16S rRNA processing protein RimM